MRNEKLVTDLQGFLVVICCLMVIGSIFIYSASSVLALETYGRPDYFLIKHIIGIILGITTTIIVSIVPLSFLKKNSPLFLIGSLLLTSMTILSPFSHQVHGSARWLYIHGFGFQPSELLKIAFIIYVGTFLEKKMYKNLSFIQSYGPLLLIMSFTSLLLLKQPDFGLTITLLTTLFLLLFIAQFHVSYLYSITAFTIPLIVIIACMQPYRIKRILAFLNPWNDPKGSGFQIIQSLIAIGSGGVWGNGIAQSKQKFFYLPMQYTDFIFSIIAEETGFIGASFIIFLYILFLYFGLRIALRMSSIFSFFVVMGFICLTMLQTLINLAVITGLMPTKGIGLPFISYGNTALICNCAMVGFIIAIVRDARYTHATTPVTTHL